MPVRVTKLPTTFFMFTKVPSTYLDQWLALSTNFPREYTCSLTKRLGYKPGNILFTSVQTVQSAKCKVWHNPSLTSQTQASSRETADPGWPNVCPECRADLVILNRLYCLQLLFFLLLSDMGSPEGGCAWFCIIL